MHPPFVRHVHALSGTTVPVRAARPAALDLHGTSPGPEGSGQLTSDALGRVVGSMRTGVILVDAEGDVTYLNDTAKEALSADIGLVLRGERVVATSPDARRRLATALAHACRPPFLDSAILLGPGRSDPIARPLRVLSFERLAGTNRAVDRSLALLCLGGIRRRAPDPDLLAQLFGLTPAEAALMAGIAGGARLHQCASQRGVSLATVRAQLRNVFVKTGAATQADLTLIAWSIPGLWLN